MTSQFVPRSFSLFLHHIPYDLPPLFPTPQIFVEFQQQIKNLLDHFDELGRLVYQDDWIDEFRLIGAEIRAFPIVTGPTIHDFPHFRVAVSVRFANGNVYLIKLQWTQIGFNWGLWGCDWWDVPAMFSVWDMDHWDGPVIESESDSESDSGSDSGDETDPYSPPHSPLNGVYTPTSPGYAPGSPNEPQSPPYSYIPERTPTRYPKIEEVFSDDEFDIDVSLSDMLRQ